MKKQSRTTVCFLCLLASNFAARAQEVQTLSAKIDTVKNIEYCIIDGRPLLLDLYFNPQLNNQPLIVWVHGGAWLFGDKGNPPAVQLLTENGFAIASINYRLSPQAIFPAQIEDCKAAIRWLRKNAGSYHINPDKIGAWGASAGGHLVALLGTTEDTDFLNDCNSSVSLRSQKNTPAAKTGSADAVLVIRFPIIFRLITGQL